MSLFCLRGHYSSELSFLLSLLPISSPSSDEMPGDIFCILSTPTLLPVTWSMVARELTAEGMQDSFQASSKASPVS